MAASCCLRPCSGCIPSCRHCSLTPAIKGANSTTRSKKSCLTCERRSSSARIRPKDSWCCPSAGSLSVRWRGSTAAADSPRIGRTSIVPRSHFCASPQSGSCSENFVILTDVSGQTLRRRTAASGADCLTASRDEPAGTLQLREFAFARNSLVFFARALDEIFELAPVVRELLGHFVSAAGRIPTDGTPKAHDITDLEFV
jgi:hypothetical protein